MTDGGKTSDGKTSEKKTPLEDNAQKEELLNEEINQEIVYYYSRERRLNHASPRVRALNDGTPNRPSLSNSIFGTRGNIFLFVSIIIICAMFGLAFRSSGRGSETKLGKNTVTLRITREEGILILEIVKNSPKTGEAYTGEVDIAVSPVLPKSGENEINREYPGVFTHRVFFHPVDTESFQSTLPFEENNFVVLLIAGDDHKAIRVNVK